MRLNTFRHQWGKGSSATYWQRRFLALAGGLAVFALLAWAVSGALGKIKVISPAANVAGNSGYRPAGSGAGPGAAKTRAPRRSPAPGSPRPAASATGHAARAGPHP